jgi:hypothetical protein
MVCVRLLVRMQTSSLEQLNARGPVLVSAKCPPALFFPQAVIPHLRHAAHFFFARLWKPFGEPTLYAIWHAILHHPRITGAIAIAIILLTAGIWRWIVSRRPSAEELERRRRVHLSTQGRITDGFILDAISLDGEESLDPTPQVLVYSYRIAGVTYNCAQDVSMLPELVRGYRLDQPISVRYDSRHPGNSILVSETWSGLW